MQAAADRVGERVWPLPLPTDYRRGIDSSVADIKNVGPREGGALTAGLFLQEFVDGVPWVHLDIAGPAFIGSDDGYLPKGGTGFGVRTLIELARHLRAARSVGRDASAQSRAAQSRRAQVGVAEVGVTKGHDPQGRRRGTGTHASVKSGVAAIGVVVATLALVASALVLIPKPAVARVPPETPSSPCTCATTCSVRRCSR